MDRIPEFSQPLLMRTMDCAMLETLLQNHEPIELIDVRPAAKFAAMHIPGARSLPLSTLTAPTRSPLPVRPDGVYIISDSNLTASLASGILRASGCLTPVVVEGGINAWVEQGLPVSRRVSPGLALFLRAGAIFLGVGTIVAFFFGQNLVAAALFLNAGPLYLKANQLERRIAREARETGLS
jgi:rhodanese-related sulfurtransferase